MGKLPEFYADQIFAGPFKMMLEYKGIQMESPQVIRWIEAKQRKAEERGPPSTEHERGVARYKSKPRQKSTRIIRSVAKKLDMCGQRLESTFVREFLLFACDYVIEVNRFYLIQAGIRPGNEKKAFNMYVRPALAYLLPILDSKVKRENSGFILKSGLSYVDFIFAEQLKRVNNFEPFLLAENFPCLLEYQKRVFRAWRERKQVSPIKLNAEKRKVVDESGEERSEKRMRIEEVLG